jgi:hypothetical protein
MPDATFPVPCLKCVAAFRPMKYIPPQVGVINRPSGIPHGRAPEIDTKMTFYDMADLFGFDRSERAFVSGSAVLINHSTQQQNMAIGW